MTKFDFDLKPILPWLAAVTRALSVFKARLAEKSTWIFLGSGVAAASALPAPWSYVSLGFAFVSAMVPDVHDAH